MEIIERFFGKEFQVSKDAFEKELKQIEKDHMDFFESRESKYPSDKHDRLHSHYMFYYDGVTVKFGFENDTVVPVGIIDKCLAAFEKHFKIKNKS